MGLVSVYSKINPGQLLHCIINTLECSTGRIDISPSDKFLQASVMTLPKDKHIPPHIHLSRHYSSSGPIITQESWVIMKGKIRIRLFDINNLFLIEEELTGGSLLVTFNGGHSLQCIEDGTIMLEFKNGPYLGRDFEVFSDLLM